MNNHKQGLNEFGTFLIVPSLVHFSITIMISVINWPYCAFYNIIHLDRKLEQYFYYFII